MKDVWFLRALAVAARVLPPTPVPGAARIGRCQRRPRQSGPSKGRPQATLSFCAAHGRQSGDVCPPHPARWRRRLSEVQKHRREAVSEGGLEQGRDRQSVRGAVFSCHEWKNYGYQLQLLQHRLIYSSKWLQSPVQLQTRAPSGTHSHHFFLLSQTSPSIPAQWVQGGSCEHTTRK